MSELLTLVAIAVLPLAVTAGVLALLRRVSGAQAAARRGARRDLLVRELSQAGAEHAALAGADPCPDGARLRAVAARYDALLLDCCAELGLPVHGRPPLSGFARLEAEAELARAGVRW